MNRKALAAVALIMLAVLVILPLYMRRAFDSLLTDAYKTAPPSRLGQHEQQSRFAGGVGSADRVPMHQLVPRAGVREKVENMNVQPSGALVGELAEDESTRFDVEEATGLPSASMDAGNGEYAETPETENMNVQPSGAHIGELPEDENIHLDPEERRAATGAVSR